MYAVLASYVGLPLRPPRPITIERVADPSLGRISNLPGAGG
jgi:hypothetical protein